MPKKEGHISFLEGVLDSQAGNIFACPGERVLLLILTVSAASGKLEDSLRCEL